MNRKFKLVISLILLISIAACITMTSLAWYSTYYVGSQSLDFAVFSKSIVTLVMDSTDFYADFRPAHAYRGAVAAGFDVSDIFAEPFYYSSDGVNFAEATSEQLAARLALRYYDSTQPLEKDQYPLATTAQLLDNGARANLRYFTGLAYEAATDSQIEAALCIYVKIGNEFNRALKIDLEGPFVEKKAQIGVANIRFDYYGAESETSVLTLSCQVLSKWPNAPADAEFIASEENDGVDNSLWMKDIGDEISYIICVSGTMGDFVPDEKLGVSILPSTTMLVQNEAGSYVPFTIDYAPGTMYLFDSNVGYYVLKDYFGIDSIGSRIAYVDTTAGEVVNFGDVHYDNEEWAAANASIVEEMLDDGTTYRYALYNAIREAYSTNKMVEFKYNNIRYTVEEDAVTEDRFNVYKNTAGIGRLNTTTTMNLDFYIFLWYNQVDELLSPNVTFGDIGLAITVDTTGA